MEHHHTYYYLYNQTIKKTENRIFKYWSILSWPLEQS